MGYIIDFCSCVVLFYFLFLGWEVLVNIYFFFLEMEMEALFIISVFLINRIFPVQEDSVLGNEMMTAFSCPYFM